MFSCDVSDKPRVVETGHLSGLLALASGLLSAQELLRN